MKTYTKSIQSYITPVTTYIKGWVNDLQIRCHDFPSEFSRNLPGCLSVASVQTVPGVESTLLFKGRIRCCIR